MAANTVSDFEQLILDEIDVIQDASTIRTIYDLIEHAKKEEKKAENRELRPRPDGTENAAYYRSAINFGNIPSTTLVDNINDLLNYLETLENLLNNASN